MNTPKQVNTALVLFLVSMSALLLEVLQMRIFAYSLQFFMVHIAVAVSMLGWGIGAAFLSAVVAKEMDNARRARLLTITLSGYFITLIATNAAFARMSHNLPIHSGNILNTAIVFSVMSLPYVFAGFAISVLFIAPQQRIPKLYMINLLGSAIGCMAVFPLMPPLGAPLLLSCIALLVAICVVLVQLDSKQKMLAGVLTGGPALASIFGAGILFPFQPESTDQYQAIKNEIAKVYPNATERREFQLWDPSGVAEVFNWYDANGRQAVATNVPHPVESKLYMQDGGAGSLLYNFGPDLKRGRQFFENTIYGVPYFASAPKDILIIGLGGAVDMQTALHFGAERITGVDINRAVIDLVHHDFKEFLGDPYGRDGVSIVHSDGRTAAKRAREQYDLIHMTGADTKAIWVSAATILNTNFLYTREAFHEYWRALKPGDSRLSITRFSIDLFRLAATAWEVLKAEGVEDPSRHILITFQGMWGNLLVKKSPFTDQELVEFRAAIATQNNAPENWANVQWLEFLRFTDDLTFNLNYPFEIAWAPDASSPDAFKAYEEMLTAYRENRQSEFFNQTYASANQDHSPISDDRPFFFFRSRIDDVLQGRSFLVNIYMSFMGLIAILTLMGVFLPLLVRKFIQPSSVRAGNSVSPLSLIMPALYFFGLGAGFMLIEVGLMQQLVVFLGNQTRSVSVVLSGLLVFSGIGSLLSGRWSHDELPRRIRWCGLGILAATAALQLILPFINDALITWPAFMRCLAVLMALAPLGLTMGVMFPSGLRLMELRAPHFIPWAMSLNSFASVMASVGFIVLALLAGFRGAIIAGGLFYIISIAASLSLRSIRGR